MSLFPAAKELTKYQFLLHPHYLINILLSSSFFILKPMPYACDFLFETCVYEMREMELLTFLGCVLALKTRKDRMHLVFIPAPASYSGPENITYFRGVNLEDELNRDKRIVWFIAFYAPWSPPCVTFADAFSKLSYDYALDNLKFGKIDASRYQDIAKKYRVDGSSWSKQLPTVIMFENGKEKMRRPYVDYKGSVQKFSFTERNMKDHFQLNELFNRQKANPIRKHGAKPDTEKKAD